MPRWIPLKQWLSEKAAETGCCPNTVFFRLRYYQQWQIYERRTNQRVIYVDADSATVNTDPFPNIIGKFVGRQKLKARVRFLAAWIELQREWSRKIGHSDILIPESELA